MKRKYMRFRNLALAMLIAAPMMRAAAIEWYADPGAPWRDAAWKARLLITVDAAKVAGDLSDFPLLVRLERDDLRSTANGGGMGREDGGDILFTAGDGVAQLSHEIESYDPAAGELVAWVRIPFLSAATNTPIHLYFGNAAADDQSDAAGTWESRFRIVQHFEETASPYADSTAGNNDGANVGAVSAAEGPANGAIELAKTYVDVADPGDNLTNLTAFADGFTVETWVNLADDLTDCAIASAGMGTGAGWVILRRQLNKKILFEVEGRAGTNLLVESAIVSTGEWYYVVATYTPHPDTVSITVNESTVGSQTVRNWYTPPTGTAFQIGRRAYGNSIPWDGRLDEFRVSDVARSEAYRLTAYRNQSEPDAFYTAAPSPVAPFAFRRRLTVAESLTDETLGDFPLLVKLQLDDLKDRVHGGGVEQADGADLLFTADDGVTRLDHEIEKYDGTSGDLIAWVRMPSLAADGGTGCFLYYGNATCIDLANPAGVWRSRYRLVQHFEETDAPFSDSTVYGNVGSNFGTEHSAAGIIDGCRVFNHVETDYVSIDDPGNNLTNLTHLVDGFTIEAWVKPASNSVSQVIASSAICPGSNSGWLLFHEPTAKYLAIQNVTTGYWQIARSANGSISTGCWHHVVATYDPGVGTCAIALNGVSMAGTPSGGMITPDTAGNLFTIGKRSFASAMAWSGHIDEFRVSDLARSAGYAAACYRNQSDPGAYVLAGRAQAFSQRGMMLIVR